jgi:hypothetical protein
MLQTTYLILCILGTVLPYSQFGPFLIEHGFDLGLFFKQLWLFMDSRDLLEKAL